jgi:hypothetical protein
LKPRHIVLGATLAAATGLAVLGDRGDDAVVEPVTRPATAVAHTQAHSPAAPVEVGILRLQPRATLIGDGADGFNAGFDDAFGTRNWTPPPPPPEPAPPPPPPSAPPMPFTLIGKALEEGRWEVWLARGEQSYIARDGDVIDGTYRVESIRPPLMTLVYLPLNQVQQLNIGVFD